MKLAVDWKPSPAELAAAFCEMDDERQAQFFIDVARIATLWDGDPGIQWMRVGRHLRDCACSTDNARDMVREIASATEAS